MELSANLIHGTRTAAAKDLCSRFKSAAFGSDQHIFEIELDVGVDAGHFREISEGEWNEGVICTAL